MTHGKDEASGKPEPSDAGETPFQRFHRVARRVVSVPKSEIEKRERERRGEQKPQS